MRAAYPAEGKEHRRKRPREDQHQGCAVAENLFRRGWSPRPIMMDARGEPPMPASAAKAEIIIISGMHTPTCERLRADPFDVADIHTVHHIIEYVYDLRGYRGHRKPEQETCRRCPAQGRSRSGFPCTVPSIVFKFLTQPAQDGRHHGTFLRRGLVFQDFHKRRLRPLQCAHRGRGFVREHKMRIPPVPGSVCVLR